MELVREILTTPALYRMITEDGSPLIEEFQPTEHPQVWNVLAYDGTELLGCFLFHPENSICWQVHTCLLPSALTVAGRSVEVACGLIRWIWENTRCLRITTHVPDFNRLALRFALKAGMIRFGYNDMSFLKNGKLYGQTYLGISKLGVTSFPQ